jgi:hypothetical protein
MPCCQLAVRSILWSVGGFTLFREVSFSVRFRVLCSCLSLCDSRSGLRADCGCRLPLWGIVQLICETWLGFGQVALARDWSGSGSCSWSTPPFVLFRNNVMPCCQLAVRSIPFLLTFGLSSRLCLYSSSVLCGLIYFYQWQVLFPAGFCCGFITWVGVNLFANNGVLHPVGLYCGSSLRPLLSWCRLS